MAHFELEIKAKVKDREKLISYFLNNGWKKLRYYAEDIYFEHPCKKFSAGEELRYRKEIIEDERKVLLTYKKGSDPTHRLEIEIEVSDEILLILDNLGFRRLLSKKKEGFIFMKDNVKATLTFVTGSFRDKEVRLGDFIEVEILSEKEDENAVKELERFVLSLPGVSEIDNEFYADKIIRATSNTD